MMDRLNKDKTYSKINSTNKIVWSSLYKRNSLATKINQMHQEIELGKKEIQKSIWKII